MTDWVFDDPPNVAVIAARTIVEEGAWIARVSHDDEDGAWQFQGDTAGAPRAAEARVVSLRSVVARDPSLAQLADLPLGWRAWRAAPDAPWQRARADRRVREGPGPAFG